MNEVIKTILERRTIRHFESEQIKNEDLDIILQAGLWAPCAGGRQSSIMLVCQNSDVNRKLGIINRNLFGKANSDEIRYVSKIQKSIADDDDIKSGFYNAPTVITLFAPRNWIYSAQDCSMAAESMSIAAWSIGVGSCYVSRAEKTFMSEEGKDLIAKAGINDTYEAKVCLCLGYIKGEIGQGKPRKENRILFEK